MIHLFRAVLGIIFAAAIIAVINIQSALTTTEYTADEMIAAYEAGHFRVIHTRGTWLEVSPDRTYIYAHENGIYRISDGAFFEQFDNAKFSPDGVYVAQIGDGIYHLANLEQIITTDYQEVGINHYVDGQIETRTWAIIGDIHFSENGEYVAITGDGVYRLSDRQKVIDTSQQEIVHSQSLKIEFNADSSAVLTIDGIFRLSDGQLLFPTSDYFARLSPDGSHALTRDGVIHLSDGKKVLDVYDDVFFTPQSTYAVVPGNGVYRLSDGQHLYDLPEIAPPFLHPIYSPDGQYMAVGSNGLYRIEDGAKLSDSSEVIFSPDNSHVAIGQDGIYRLRDMQKLFDLDSAIDGFSHFSRDGTYLAVSDAIIRIEDGQRLFGSGTLAAFSPDSEYVAFSDSGLYRLSDQQKMFDLVGMIGSFSPDGAYISVNHENNFGLYRVRDGQYYPDLRFLSISAGIMAGGNTVLVIEPI